MTTSAGSSRPAKWSSTFWTEATAMRAAHSAVRPAAWGLSSTRSAETAESGYTDELVSQASLEEETGLEKPGRRKKKRRREKKKMKNRKRRAREKTNENTKIQFLMEKQKH